MPICWRQCPRSKDEANEAIYHLQCRINEAISYELLVIIKISIASDDHFHEWVVRDN